MTDETTGPHGFDEPAPCGDPTVHAGSEGRAPAARQPRGATKHAAGCLCVRCTGFQPGSESGLETRAKPGNELAVKHGAYRSSSVLLQQPRVVELLEWAQAVATWLTPADEPALQLWALATARLELLSAVLLAPLSESPGAIDEWAAKVEARPNVSRDARGWHSQAIRLARELGLTPSGRAELEVARSRVVALDEAAAAFGIFFEVIRTWIPAVDQRAALAELDRRLEPLLGIGSGDFLEGDVGDGEAVGEEGGG